MLAGLGVDTIGIPLRLEFNREELSDSEAAEICAALPQEKKAVVITYLSAAKDIIELCRAVGTDWVQLHGAIDERELLRLRDNAPGMFIIKSLIVRPDDNHELSDELQRTARYVDAYITDTFDPETGHYGATGKVHNWNVSRRIVTLSAKPVILAGGLNPENVKEAIVTVKPAGVDAHTALERPDGGKDKELVRAFVKKAKEAFNELSSA
ncbi:MAG: phosphoribosylanthranilate isomerase [Candidatus Dadabacteria bacterium]|nr:MAG: phosphoribosylanthranilate isomerase [Candidatus Dadabacteria bacterium]